LFNPFHTLHSLLTPPRLHTHNLRSRSHPLTIPQRDTFTQLSFIRRMLFIFSSCLWFNSPMHLQYIDLMLTAFLSVNIFPSLLFCSVSCICQVPLPIKFYLSIYRCDRLGICSGVKFDKLLATILSGVYSTVPCWTQRYGGQYIWVHCTHSVTSHSCWVFISRC